MYLCIYASKTFVSIPPQAAAASSSTSFASKCLSVDGWVHALPLRPHGLCVAGVAFALSLCTLVACATLLLRNAVLQELASLPPGCSGYTKVKKWYPPSRRNYVKM